MNRKFAIALTVCLLAILLLAGCARNTQTPSPTNTPMSSPLSSIRPLATPTKSPTATTTPGISPSVRPSTATNSPIVSAAPTQGSGDDLEMAKRIEAEVDKLSEVKKSVALVSGTTALIAVEYDDAYRGDMTDRIRSMVEEKAKGVDSGLTQIAITDDAGMLEEVREMRRQVDGGSLIEDIRTEFDKLLQRIKPTA